MILSPLIHIHFLEIKMDLEALKQTLASLDINPDEIEDKRYATAFRILFAIIEKQTKRSKLSKQRTRNFETKSTYSKVNKPNLKFVVLKRMMISLLKTREDNEILEKTGNRIQERTK
jgi:hypothetical protein